MIQIDRVHHEPIIVEDAQTVKEAVKTETLLYIRGTELILISE